MSNSLSAYFRCAKWAINPDKYLADHTSNKPPFTYVHFTDILKLGINPRTKFITPIGIYGYILNNKIANQINDGTLPFASDRKYVYFFKAKPGTKLLYTSRGESTFDYEKIIRKLLSDTFKKEWRNALGIFDDTPTGRKIFINDSEKRARGPSNSISKFWNLTRLLAKENPLVWSSILRRLRLDGIVDDAGWGLIHPNEPTQALFFLKNSIEIDYAGPNILNPSVRYRYSLKELFKKGSEILDKKINMFKLNVKKIEDVSLFKCEILTNTSITIKKVNFIHSTILTRQSSQDGPTFINCKFSRCPIFLNVTGFNKFINCVFNDCHFKAEDLAMSKYIPINLSFNNCRMDVESKLNFRAKIVGINTFEWNGPYINDA